MRSLYSIVAGLSAMLVGSTACAANCDGFTDVDSANTTYCSAVTYLKDKGVTLGCGDGSTYCPNDPVTRLQMALFLQRMGRGGADNVVSDTTATVGGGDDNDAQSSYSTVAGGNSNTVQAMYGSVGGGTSNFVSGVGATIPGGGSNVASGNFSFAAGFFANANTNGCFVLADASSGAATSCGSTPNQFVVRALGGVHLLTSGTSDATYAGAQLASGSGSWTTYSDRNGKDNVQAIDPLEVLARVDAMPVATWHYKAQDASIRHMGPMAQDFYAAFNIGETDKGISVVDAQGVALAAIQGLNAKLESQNAALRKRIERLEATMAH